MSQVLFFASYSDGAKYQAIYDGQTIQQLRDIHDMRGWFLMNFHFDLPDRFTVRFPTYIRQSIQSAQCSFIQRFCVNDHAMFRIVGVL